MYIGKKDIENHAKNILNKSLEKDLGSVAPKADNAGYNKYGRFWLTAVSIDIRGFKKMCEAQSNLDIIRLVQAYSSSLIKIMKKNDNFRDCYVNGDEVIGVFAANKKGKIGDNIKTAILANSFANYLFPKMLKDKGISISFKSGVGVWTSPNNSIVMYGEKSSGNESFSTVIGDAVNWASYLATEANKNTDHQILFNQLTKINLTIDKYQNNSTFWSNINDQKVYGFSYRYNEYAEE